MIFNEDSRVKIPALVHLTRLGYTFLTKKEMINVHEETNIFIDLFTKGISKINNAEYSDQEINLKIADLSNQLYNNDLGRAFYNNLTSSMLGYKLIDFDNFDNNIFNIVTELPCKNGESSFRPDITVLINGLPLIFIEVKKPNNQDGMLDESSRIDRRFQNEKFKKFMNITQFMIFTNNQNYNDDTVAQIQGAYYATPDIECVKFNRFREEETDLNQYLSVFNAETEKSILIDTNLVSILETDEYKTNLDSNTPANQLITSLLTRKRLCFLLKYGITYVETEEDKIKKIEKHIMRYPQLFAAQAIVKKLDAGIKKGIIWHTQGSGKTALAYYCVKYLRDYYQKKGIIAKFYFIVDRLDLANQAKGEFESRKLAVNSISTRDDFVRNIKNPAGETSLNGQHNITVLNIHRIPENATTKKSDYSLKIQRVYFLDEVHRSYKPDGTFFGNLISSDRNAVLIGLTGTPIIGEGYNSKEIFGDYFHKYYYNQSIADGFTLKLIREGIETRFKTEMQELLKKIETKSGTLQISDILSHPQFVKPLTNYIVRDLINSRIQHNDSTIGGMIICQSSEQARMIYNEIINGDREILDYLQKANANLTDYKLSAEKETNSVSIHSTIVDKQKITAALILCDADDAETLKGYQRAFKKGEIDFLVVFQMLLTGFDAKRLKKLYLMRTISDHNLLQALTRVNRPYKNFKYGYVVDFADIRTEFEQANKAYWEELNRELSDDEAKAEYSNIFKSDIEIKTEIEEIKNKLFGYNLQNLEEFQKKVSSITSKKEIIDLKNNLDNLKCLYNIINIMDYQELTNLFSFDKINKLYHEVENRLNILRLKEKIDSRTDKTALINIALEDMQFSFKKIAESELQIVSDFKNAVEKARKELESCLDKKDPVFCTLYDELKRIFGQRNIEEVDTEEMKRIVKALEEIFRRSRELNDKDLDLTGKYEFDAKFIRIHKRIKDRNLTGFNDDALIIKILLEIKHQTDNLIVNMHAVLNTPYFDMTTKSLIADAVTNNGLEDMEIIEIIHGELTAEYKDERVA